VFVSILRTFAAQLEKVQGARGQLEALQETHGTESAAAAEQKAALDRMNEETQALMEAAKREQGAAEQRHVALMEVRAALHRRAHEDGTTQPGPTCAFVCMQLCPLVVFDDSCTGCDGGMQAFLCQHVQADAYAWSVVNLSSARASDAIVVIHMQAHNAAVAHKQTLMDRQTSLATAETELSALQNHLSELAAAVSDAEARRSKLEQELIASQHRIDKAQARKEEVSLMKCPFGYIACLLQLPLNN